MAGKVSGKAAWEVEFCSVPLSREQIEQALKWDEDLSKTERAFINALMAGCKIGFSGNVGTGAFICSVTVPDPVKGTKRLCFTSHAPDLWDVARITSYKIEVALDGDVYAVHGEIGSGDVYR